MQDLKEPPPTFLHSLNEILLRAEQSETIKLEEIFSLLAGKGYATFLILFSLPLCFPIQIPGFSTPFGIILTFIGFRIAFKKHLWWPKWVLEKKLSSQNVIKIAHKAITLVRSSQKILRPRLTAFVGYAFFKRLNGVLVAFLGILLALPLPIPMTNLLAAFPILCIGFGLLEDDGLVVLIGYFFALLCFTAFIALFITTQKIFGFLP